MINGRIQKECYKMTLMLCVYKQLIWSDKGLRIDIVSQKKLVCKNLQYELQIILTVDMKMVYKWGVKYA